MSFEHRHLRVRTGAGAAYRRSFSDGVTDLRHAACTNSVEDLWYFFGDSSWLDLGIDEKPTQVRLDVTALERLVSNTQPGASLAEFHTHPVGSDRHLYSPPSPVDVIAHSLRRRVVEQARIALTSTVVDGFGTWEYSTSDLIDEMIGKGHIELSMPGSDVDVPAEAVLHYRMTLAFLDLASAGGAKSLAQYLDEMASFGVLMRYTPF